MEIKKKSCIPELEEVLVIICDMKFSDKKDAQQRTYIEKAE